MTVRIKLRIVSKLGGEVSTSALVNLGFEVETPQLLVPRALASRLGLWPPPPDAYLVEVGIAGAPSGTTLFQKQSTYTSTQDTG